MDIRITGGPASARLLKSSPGKKLLWISLLILLYALVLPPLYSTAGDPRRDAEKAHAEKREAAELAAFDEFDAFNGTETAEVGEGKKKDEDNLPPEWLPSALSVLALFGVVTSHALFHLLCRWTPTFEASALFTAAESEREADSILIHPPANRGKPAIVKIDRSFDKGEYAADAEGAAPLGRVSFQRQQFLLYPGHVSPLPLPTDLPVSYYLNSKGIDPEDVKKLRDKHGVNDTSLPPPKFVTLLMEQMLSPLAVFQVFSSLLWFLDGYSIMYTLVNLGTTVMFEGMTVFQRTKTQGMLGGMGGVHRKINVFRNEWMTVDEKEVLPGDLVVVEEGSIAFDCVIIGGAGVVNEAMLTGESIPLLKDPLPLSASSDKLDADDVHKIHALSSGTILLSSTPPATLPNSLPAPPAKGLLAVVLRTGFSSSQGALLQLIAYSQSPVSSDTKETFYALLMLFCFAVVAAGYVWKEGMGKGKSVHDLVVRSVVIVTSVVPRGLPMQMATAVHTALLSLFRAGIFCTEPHKVPLAGKVTHVVFDKTGTVTSDKLEPVGVVNADAVVPVNVKSGSKGNNDKIAGKEWEMVAMKEAMGMAEIVLAACHSLVAVEQAGSKDKDKEKDKEKEKQREPVLAGDPIEVAALKGVEWSWDHATSCATPGAAGIQELALRVLKRRLEELNGVPEDRRTVDWKARVEQVAKDVKGAEEMLERTRKQAGESKIARVEVVQRHHFASGLQRMSVVAKVVPRGGKEEWTCLVKGSPEALKPLLEAGGAPDWYKECYESMARRGLRVLALAYKTVKASDKPALQTREWVESGLKFAGFVAFECKTRADSGVVIRALLDSGHHVGMLTGDGLLTSLHVARQVGICRKDALGATLHVGDDGKPFWIVRNEADGSEREVAFELDSLGKFAVTHDLSSTESDFLTVAESTGGKASPLWKHTGKFKVFSRMSPHGKATMIRAMQESNSDVHVLMCGDGGNDVGALKQADVAMALLAGHGSTNTSDEIASEGDGKEAEAELNKHTALLQKKTNQFEAARVAHMKEFQGRINREMQAKLQEEIAKRVEKGEYMAMFTVMKEHAARIRIEVDAENRRFYAVHGQVWDPKKKDQAQKADGMLGNLMAQLEAESGDTNALPVIRPGDASVAAPFTSRVPSIRAVVDLIRQGRCTLLSALMQQQIMMLESIIAAYTLSALSLHNARSSERQMMASSWLIMTAAVAFSYASPVDRMHHLRPIRSLFHPAIIVSIFGQALIHIACMTLAVNWATDAMGPDKLAEVTEFFRKAKAKEIDVYAACGDTDYICLANAFWQAPFLPNLLNSVVFLVETSQMISVFFANYKGRPWMKGMMENHALFLSVFVCIGAVVVAAWEMVPVLNEMIQLVPFPDDAFRYKVVALLSATIVGTFAWDRFCTYLFAPDVFGAMMEEAWKTSLKDMQPILVTLLKVFVVVYILGSGNILLAGAVFFGWRNFNQYKAKQEAEREAAAEAAS